MEYRCVSQEGWFTVYRIFSNLIRNIFADFLNKKKAVLIRTFPSTAPCLQGRLIE